MLIVTCLADCTETSKSFKIAPYVGTASLCRCGKTGTGMSGLRTALAPPVSCRLTEVRVPPPLHVQGTSQQRERLQQMTDQADSPRTRTRVQMVLLSPAGYDVPAIAAITQQSDETIRRRLHRSDDEGGDGLLELPHPGCLPDITLAIETFLRECIAHHSPHEFGWVRATWTTALFAQVAKRQFRIRVTGECIRQ